MIPHWDLIPGEPVTLTTPSGRALAGTFLFRDTLHACVRIESDADRDPVRKWFLLSNDGKLHETFKSPARMRGQSGIFPAPAIHTRIWTVSGQRENTRFAASEAQKYKWDRTKGARA